MGEDVFDVAIVGAGPAGLMAALKSALLFHTAIVLDKGARTSRAFFVPRMDNIPGYPEGVSGQRIMEDLRRQIENAEKVAGRTFVTYDEPAEITRLVQDEDGVFTLTGHRIEGRDKQGEAIRHRARAVVLATGVVDRQPYIGEGHDIKAILPYANKGIADYCLLCDGHTIRGKSVAVLGMGRGAADIAKTLRDHFGASRVALVTCVACVTGEADHDHERHAETLAQVEAEGLEVIDKRIARLEGIREDRIRLVFDDDERAEFDRAWISFGWYRINNDLARQVGASLDEEGYVRTSEDCEALDEAGTPIAGLFVIGDLRAETWKQVPIALGDAETAIIHAFAMRL